MPELANDFVMIALCFAFGFFFESIFGFGGGLIAYSILAFAIDLKLAVLAGLYIGTIASLQIIAGSYRHLNWKILAMLLPLAAIGSSFGGIIFNNFSSKNLSLFFGLLLLILAARIMFFDHYKIPKIFKQKLLFVGAICQGTFGVGGPFVVNAIKDDFKNRSEIRATMAAYFLFCNCIRIVQLSITGKFTFDFLNKAWWIIIPVFITIWLGHFFHRTINENHFKKGVGLITTIAAVRFISLYF